MCGSAHCSGCVVDGRSATAATYLSIIISRTVRDDVKEEAEVCVIHIRFCLLPLCDLYYHKSVRNCTAI